MQCDLCGKEHDDLVDAVIEGSMVSVCLECSKHGSVVTINQAVVDKKIERKQDLDQKYVDIIRDDFSVIIKKSREKKGLTQDDLAKNIAEKASVIHQLESGNLKPSLRLAKKLEVFLTISLVETVKQDRKIQKSINFRDRAVTVGDLMKKQ